MDWRWSVGGSRALVEALDKAGDSLYADCLRFYGVDLRDLFSESTPLSPRRALVLVQGLPSRSVSSAVLAGSPDAAEWGVDTYLLASAVNALRETVFVLCKANSKRSSKIPSPKFIPLPGVKAKQEENNFIKMARATYARLRGE